MDEEQLKEALSDSAFSASLMEMETPEEVQAALKEKGIDLTLPDINAVRMALESGESSELSDNELEHVAGGSLTIMAALGIASIITAACGAAVGLGNSVNKWTRRRW